MSALTDAVATIGSVGLYWRLGETSGTYADSSGNGRAGTVIGTPTTRGADPVVAGEGDKAVRFSAANSAVRNTSYTPGVDGTTRTFVLFYNRLSHTSVDSPFSGATAVASRLWTADFFTNVQDFRFGFVDNNLSTWTAANPSDNARHMVALVAQQVGAGASNNIELFIDATSQGKKSNTGAWAGTGISVGQHFSGSNFDGYCDEFIVFEKGLTSTEIATLWAAGDHPSALAQADTVTPSDSISKKPGKVFAETPALADAIAKAFGLRPADSAAPSDSISKAPRKILAETVTPIDLTSEGVHLGVVDSVALTEALMKAGGVVLGDTASALDEISKAPARPIDEAAIDLDDELSRHAEIARDDSLTLADLLVTEAEIRLGLADSVALSENLSRSWAALLAIGDALDLADDLDRARRFARWPPTSDDIPPEHGDARWPPDSDLSWAADSEGARW